MLILKEIRPRGPSGSLPRVGGNRKRRSFAICPVCLGIFGPLSHLKRKYCSRACKTKAQTTGRQRLRRTTREAKSAQSLVRYHVRAGNIARPTCCEECGVAASRIEAAHYDYAEPLRVRWLCRSCHVRWDKQAPKGATFLVPQPGAAKGRIVEQVGREATA